MEVILKIRRRTAVFLTNAISRELSCVDQVADSGLINMQQCCYFLVSQKLFHSDCAFAFEGILHVITSSPSVYHSLCQRGCRRTTIWFPNAPYCQNRDSLLILSLQYKP